MKLFKCIVSLCTFYSKMNEFLDPYRSLYIKDFSHLEDKYFMIEYLDNLNSIDIGLDWVEWEFEGKSVPRVRLYFNLKLVFMIRTRLRNQKVFHLAFKMNFFDFL